MRLAQFGMQGRVIAHTGGISLTHLAHIGGQLGITGIHRFPHAQQMHDVVRLRRIDAIRRRQRAPRGEHHILDRSEIVLAMREAQAESDIGVAMPEDMRYAEIVAYDAHMILRSSGDEGLRIGLRRLVQPIDGDHHAEPKGNQHHKRQHAIFYKTHKSPAPVFAPRRLTPARRRDKPHRREYRINRCRMELCREVSRWRAIPM